MNMRSSSYTVTFLHPFRLTGFSDELPAGTYEVLIQEELMGGYGSENYQTKATYMTFSGKGGRP